jgi:pimeloyl-ACP methyl ester carboxylesterase
LRQLIFNIAINSTARVLAARDRLLGRIGRDLRIDEADAGVSRHAISSGRNRLDAVLVRPGAGAAQASLLICHGIGETVQHWVPVQRLLAARGVASLVFDYSGYGRSTGLFSASQAEQDVVAAFRTLEEFAAPEPVSVLGFSLGSGPVVALLDKLPVERLVLCAAYTSMRKGAVSVGVPRSFAGGVPAIWDAAIALPVCKVPVLVVHGEKDRLFPVRMAEELAELCSPPAKLIVVPGLKHNEPFYRPTMAYWGLIADWLITG